jgi:hypothetical protein
MGSGPTLGCFRTPFHTVLGHSSTTVQPPFTGGLFHGLPVAAKGAELKAACRAPLKQHPLDGGADGERTHATRPSLGLLAIQPLEPIALAPALRRYRSAADWYAR